jgi:hypothetical protein
MDERREEAKDSIRFYVWGGWHEPEEVFDIIDEEVFECDGEHESWLRGAIQREFSKKRKAERSWPEVTSFDRLDYSFRELRRRGILAQHRCGLTQQDGLDIVDSLYEEKGRKQSGISGYCFYTYQDMEGAMEGDGGMLLAFGSFSGQSKDGVAVGQLIREVLEHSCFKVKWDGTVKTQLWLRGFQWQRRSPSRRARRRT